MRSPRVADTIHYVSHGTPVLPDGTQKYPTECRAAIVTAVRDNDPVPKHGVPYVDLCAINPEGLFFNRDVKYDDGSETPGSGDCPSPEAHGNPFRYCACGWIEARHSGGTWHWPETD